MQNFGRGQWRRVGDYQRVHQSVNDRFIMLQKYWQHLQAQKRAEREQQNIVSSEPPVQDDISVVETHLPVQEEEPIIQEEPVTQEEPVIQEEPVTQEEPVIQEEPVTQEEPVIQEEPVTQEEPAVQEEQAVQEEPVIQEELAIVVTAPKKGKKKSKAGKK